jgi:arginine deiminase
MSVNLRFKFYSLFWFSLFQIIVGCQGLQQENLSLQKIETQVSENNRYDFIYVHGHQKFEHTKHIIADFLDTLDVDTTRVWGHTITFLKFKEGMPETENDEDFESWNSLKYKSSFLLTFYYFSKDESISISTFHNGTKQNSIYMYLDEFRRHGVRKQASAIFGNLDK